MLQSSTLSTYCNRYSRAGSTAAVSTSNKLPDTTVRFGGVELIYFGLDLTKLVLSGTGRESFWK